MLALPQLPTLLTDCVLIGHEKRADVVFTRPQWFAMCIHMLNENVANFFLKLYRDKDGQPKFSKAFNHDLTKWVEWSWRSITGKAKSLVAIGFYPTNAERKSRWAAMDFDAHDGNTTRARDFALKAFALLYQQPQLYVVLTTSAGNPQHTGYHLFVFSREFYPCEDWTLLLKKVAALIGAPIEDGICELFPNEFRGIGKALRAPGTHNVKTRECGLILHETLSRGLFALPASEDKETIALYLLGEPQGKNYSSSSSSQVFRGEHGEWATLFAITAPCTRHQKLLKLVGTAFFQAGKSVVRKNAEFQHRKATPVPVATLHEHLAEFDQAWSGWESKWKEKLSPVEQEKFGHLTTEAERDAFRILHNWSQTDSPDFYVSCESLGARLGKTPRGASKLRRRFCENGILRQTAPYVPHKLCARFKWTAGAEANRKQAGLILPFQQWNGDPGDSRLRRPKG